MSELRFLCPECGQKILGDAAYSGTQIACPACQKTMVVPAAARGVPPLLMPTPLAASRLVSPPAAAAAMGEKQVPGSLSALAVASLICSVCVPLGSIPGLICGHLAKARMRRDFFLEGEKMADAGLLISYCVLLATLAVVGTGLLERWHFSPVRVMRESPEAITAMQKRVVDEVIMGETEEDHDVDGRMQYTTENKGKSYHTTNRGGSFSYLMKVLPGRAMTLNCHYWGSEPRGHLFDIAVDDQVIATQKLTASAPGHFYDVEYKIPASLTRGKTQVKVEFQAHADTMAGGLYGCQILKR